MDGLFHGKPYFLMDDLGGFPIIFGSTPISWNEGKQRGKAPEKKWMALEGPSLKPFLLGPIFCLFFQGSKMPRF